MHKSFVGGFFELEFDALCTARDFSSGWFLPHDPGMTFSNARSALAALIKEIRPQKVWLPAYVCTSLAHAVPEELRYYYPLKDALEPNIDFLDHMIREGDTVISIDYFGRPPEAAFRDFAVKRNDVVFIEDCAQALETAAPPWSSWRLFSPRKLVGVPDGGYIVSSKMPKAGFSPKTRSVPDMELLCASYIRYEDEDEILNSQWHKINQKREEQAVVSDRRMSRLSRFLLSQLNPESIAKSRRENFSILNDHLENIAFLPYKFPSFCPSGFPVLLPFDLRDRVRRALISDGIFPAIHWATLPSPTIEFAYEHRLSNSLLTLPCDHRYGASQMTRIIESVRTVLGPNI